MSDQAELTQLVVNGKPIELRASSTISDLLESKDLNERLVVVEVNGEIIQRSDFGTTRLKSGDVIEVVHFVGGG
jgi:sulfur carrier protein